MRPAGSLHVRIKRVSIDSALAAAVDARGFPALIQEALRERFASSGPYPRPTGASNSGLAQDIAAAVAARVGDPSAST
jgi:hypothetical protein